MYEKKGKCINCKQDMIMKSPTHKYCCRKCEREYRTKTMGIEKVCESCGKTFKASPDNKNQRFCSVKCQGKWQSTQLGRNNPRYKKVEVECDWCHKKYDMRNYMVGKHNNHFCSDSCRKEWYSNVWSQTDEWKKESSIRATKMLSNGQTAKTTTIPQLKVNKILESMNLKYENEYNCIYYAIDNAIFYNNEIFFIEVMGSFWHCDRRTYSKIKYENQYNRIIMDKAKKSYIENKYNKKILYLWENDIDNIELCKTIIINYLNNNISYYHSSDYYINNNDLYINKDRIFQYMMCSTEDVSKHILYTAKNRQRPQCQKQIEKWITFKCDYCGNEAEQLKSKYNLRKSHYCSTECKSKAQIKKIQYKQKDTTSP